ncbi:MAG TPA: arginase family protein [Rhizomicrobium sp.]|jgi:formiminoglutamase|nr:arginase family protein [Rhizomicrobium sp.]
MQYEPRVPIYMSESDPFDPNLSENRSWLSIADLVGNFAHAKVALVGAPIGKFSITPGHCDQAPATVRAALKRMSVYDIETEDELRDMRVFDAGNVMLDVPSLKEALDPIRDAVAAQASRRDLTILLGGDNSVTRPGVHGVDGSLKSVGVMTLDAHFDLRDTDHGLNNGNPIQALLEDGLPGLHISQIGIAPFANTKKAHMKAKAAGISVRPLGECLARGFVSIVREELGRLSHQCRHIYVDFDIDVIDRGQMPSAPGARLGGISAREFFAAARVVAAHPNVTCVDLTEFDPSMDVNASGALTAARWFSEILAGYSTRLRL